MRETRMNSFTRKAAGLLRRFGRSRRGNVAMMAGIALPVLLMLSAGAIDLHHAAKVKSELQDALDAASLAAARSNYTAAADIQRVGMTSLRANMPDYFKDGSGDVANFVLASRYQIQATATVQVKTIIANVFLPPYGKLFDDYLPMSASSDVLRASRNVEVAMALDITGSMAKHMDDLKAAAKELVGIVVQGDQEVFTTRVALIPYAAGVNAGDWANEMRGDPIAKTVVTGAAWHQGEKSITAASASAFTTSQAHGLKRGDYVYLTGFVTNPSRGSSLNNKIFQVSSVSGNDFTIDAQTTTQNVAGTNRKVYRCFNNRCHTQITSVNHGLTTNDYATLSNVSGISGLNGTHQVTRIDNDRFLIPVARPSGTYSGSNGRVECHYDGCPVRKFINQGGTLRTLNISDCVSERPYAPGSNRPSDARPVRATRTNLVGRVYPDIVSSSNQNPCPPKEAAITPLTNNIGKGGLYDIIDDLKSGGSTAGQIGVEQAWYAVSPTFGAIFDAANRPNAFDSSKTVKAVILMTDGEFNTPYCQGVISQDAVDDGSAGQVGYQINCPSTNGSLFEQSVRTCEAMKAQGIVIYTVGFNLKTSFVNSVTDTAYEVMYRCASDPEENFFPAASGTDLKEAFKAIGRDITRLRIAR